MSYKYITRNNLYEKQSYMYSDYTGRTFLAEYLDSRKQFLTWQENNSKDVDMHLDIGTCGGIKAVFIECLNNLRNCNEVEYSSDELFLVKKCVQSFEVRKRIYVEYDENWKPLVTTGFEDYENYLLFAEILLCIYKKTKCMKYFSCLLKLDDTMLSVCDCMSSSCKEWLYHIIIQELDIYNQLMIEMGLDKEEVVE